ncbi:MAG: carbohydrate-binding family 6 protein [bacterium]
MNPMSLKRVLFAVALFGLWSAAAGAQAQSTLYYDSAIPQVSFAAAEIRSALSGRGGGLSEHGLAELPKASGQTVFVLASGADATNTAAKALGIDAPKPAGVQAYAIRRIVRGGRTTIAVFGADAAGTMYGGLDVAEAVRFGTLDRLADADCAPHIEKRGIKFNVPLDVRTPSYSDNSDAAQANIPEMWSFDFWREFIDELARNRFNVLTLWNLHPFPSLVKVPEYPDVALDDVMRTRVPMDDTYSHSGSDMVRPELLADVEVVKRMTIGEKIRFWRDVMQYAHDRGIEVYWFTWNIFTFGAEGKYGITPSRDNPTTLDYFRASVREMVLTYPLLAGFGITAGEQMPNGEDATWKEKWLYAAYGQGVADALERQPGREVRMIHRYHMTGHEEILNRWKDYRGPFDLSFKYSIAHMYSIPDPPFIKPALPFLSPSLRTWLTVRDDDYYSFRWGDPAFARAFIRNMPGRDKVVGFYMGPDGYIWGRDFLDKQVTGERPLVIKKRWYAFMLWGRLAYNPDLPDALFEAAIANRFPESDAPRLMRAWSHASRVLPQITRFFWQDIDLRWFPEGCLSHPSVRGFYTVQDFIHGQTMPGSGLLNIIEWRRQKLSGEPQKGEGALEVAAGLASDARAALRLANELRRAESGNPELRSTLWDIIALAHLGQYYAAKIRGAAELALFDKTSDPANRDAAVAHLRLALVHWKRYAAAYTHQYKQPRLYNRVGWVDIPGLTAKVEQDIVIASTWRPGTAPDVAAPASVDTPFRR